MFDGARQRAVLRKLQRNAGLEASDVAVGVGLSYPQWMRYAHGKVPIRSYQLPGFAKVLGVTALDLAVELGGVDLYEDLTNSPDVTPWTFRDALKGHIPEWLIEQLADEWEGRPLINQQSAVMGILQMAERQRERAWSPEKKTNAR